MWIKIKKITDLKKYNIIPNIYIYCAFFNILIQLGLIIYFTNDLAAYDWSTMKCNFDVNKISNFFKEIFNYLYDKNCPFISYMNNNRNNFNNNSIIGIK